MTSPRIVCDAAILGAAEALAELGFDQVVTLPDERIEAGVLAEADALLIRSTLRVDERLLRRSRLRFLATATVGEDHVDRALLAQRGIDFVSAAGSSAVSVAQFSLAAMSILAAKRGRALADHRLGVVGCGAIGSRVAAAAERLGLEVLRFDPPLAESTRSPAFRPIEEIGACDLVSLHVPLTEEGEHATRGMVDQRFLTRLPPGSLLVNTARGEVVDPEYLIAARRSGRIGGLAIDVFPGEPACHAGLLAHADFASPHVAGRSLEGMMANSESVLRALCAHFGRPWHRPEALRAPAPEDLEVEPQDSPVDFVQAAWGLFALDLALKEVAGAEDEDRARVFKRLRRPPYRRDLSRMRILGEPGPALRRFLAALPRR
ncbi:MAG: 4-phosphoerythronate dehydrogenase [Planctomycetes bacterium]|nr:4-phosphoerythronate dehydrogenase [Planctomycetota bacterium]